MKERIARSVRVMSAVGLLAALALLFGCAKSGSVPSAAGSSAGSTAQAGPMTVKVLEPLQGSEVSAGTVKVAVETSGIKFVMPRNDLVPGEGHVHFTLDDRPFVMSVEKEAEIKDVGPGAHTLTAELVQNDTQPFDPPVEQVIEFTVK